MTEAELVREWREALDEAQQALLRAEAASRALEQHYPAGIASDPRLDDPAREERS